MAVKLLHCSGQKALGEQGIEYDVVVRPTSRRKRDQIEQLSGQRRYPVIQFDDGSIYREESNDMAARIRAGKLFERREERAS
jgi:glutaredoxin